MAHHAGPTPPLTRDHVAALAYLVAVAQVYATAAKTATPPDERLVALADDAVHHLAVFVDPLPSDAAFVPVPLGELVDLRRDAALLERAEGIGEFFSMTGEEPDGTAWRFEGFATSRLRDAIEQTCDEHDDRQAAARDIADRMLRLEAPNMQPADPNDLPF